jgi:hypothetical protein
MAGADVMGAEDPYGDTDKDAVAHVADLARKSVRATVNSGQLERNGGACSSSTAAALQRDATLPSIQGDWARHHSRRGRAQGSLAGGAVPDACLSPSWRAGEQQLEKERTKPLFLFAD